MNIAKQVTIGATTALLFTAGTASARAASPRTSTPRATGAPAWVTGGDAICRSANAQLSRESSIGGGNPSVSQIMRSFTQYSRTLLWESRAFGALPVPASWHAPVRQIMTLYKDASEEMGFLVKEDGYGDTGAAQVDLDDAQQATRDAGRIVSGLGVKGCDAE